MIVLPHFTRVFVTRSLLAWGFLRVTVGVVSAFAAAQAHRVPAGGPFLLTPLAALALVAVVGAVGWVYARRYGEDAFVRSLGYGRPRLIATLTLPALLLEVVLGILMRA